MAMIARNGDTVLWTKTVLGADGLRERLDALPAGALVTLQVGENTGQFVKMNIGKDGRPTDGFRAADKATQAWWRTTRQTENGTTQPFTYHGRLDA